MLLKRLRRSAFFLLLPALFEFKPELSCFTLRAILISLFLCFFLKTLVLCPLSLVQSVCALYLFLQKLISDQERKQKEQENAMRADALLRGNPLVQMAGSSSANVKRRWDDDVVFRNMARDEPAEKKRFINDTIRSDFHKRFLKRYVQ